MNSALIQYKHDTEVSTALVVGTPGMPIPVHMRTTIRSRISNSDRRRLNQAQIDLIQQILRVSGVVRIKIGKSTVVVETSRMDSVDQFQVHLHLLSFMLETHAGLESESLKMDGPQFRLVA